MVDRRRGASWLVHLGYEALWLPASLLENDAQQRLADALFGKLGILASNCTSTRDSAGAPPDAIAEAKDTAMNPAVLTAFALAIAGDAQGPGISGEFPGMSPRLWQAGAAERVDRCMSQLVHFVPVPGSYVSESNYFENEWQHSYWGATTLGSLKSKENTTRTGYSSSITHAYFVADGASSPNL